MNGMKRVCRGLAGGVLLAGAALLAGCSEESTGHDQDLGGVLHRDGYENPAAAGCPACHGPDLRGGTAPSCYNCHTTVNI